MEELDILAQSPDAPLVTRAEAGAVVVPDTVVAQSVSPTGQTYFKHSRGGLNLLSFSFSTLRLTFPTFPCMNMDILIFLPINLKRCLYEGNL